MRVFVAVVIALACSGCVLLHVCTEVGCSSGLSVSVSDASGAVTEFSGELRLGADTVAFTCPDTTNADVQCRGGSVWFTRLAGEPTAATLVVSRPGGESRTFELAGLTWRTFQPNGPECPPTCRNADAAVSLE